MSGRLLVFQHVAVEHPGVFRDFLAADGVVWDTVELDDGEPIPDLNRYDGLWVFGGPMDVWEEMAHPWLIAEKAAIRHWVTELKRPYLGICLGHQLLAAALGGAVGKGQPEIGVLPVGLTAKGRTSNWLNGFPATFETLQWHGAEVQSLPENAEVLASSPVCNVQAMAVGEHAFSAQFHVEITQDTVEDWGAIPAYADALEDALGEGAIPRFKQNVNTVIETFNQDAKRLYDNWMRQVNWPAGAAAQGGIG